MNPGDTVTVRYKDRDDDGNVIWKHWFTGTYITTENIGNGREHRIKQPEHGRSIHISPTADDLQIEHEGRN